MTDATYTDQPSNFFSEFAAPDKTQPSQQPEENTFAEYAKPQQSDNAFSEYAPQQEPNFFEEFSQPDSSPGGAFARQAIKQAPSAAAGWVGGVAGAEAGAVAGTAAAPFLGPAAPAGPLIGGLIGAGAGAMGAGWLASKGEDWVLDKLGLRDNGGMLSQQQEQADVEQHPYASEAGGLADVLIGGAMGGATRGVRAVGGAIMGATTAGQEYAENGEVDPLKVGMSAAAGAVAPNPRGWVTKAASPATRFFTQTASRAATPQPRAQPQSKRHRLKATKARQLTLYALIVMAVRTHLRRPIKLSQRNLSLGLTLMLYTLT